MKYYDLHISSVFSEGKSTIDQIVKRVKLLGFSGICLVENYKNFKKIGDFKNKISKKEIEIFIGVEAKNREELGKLIKKRGYFDLLFVKGGDLKLNRKAVESSEVDVLSTPEYGRKESGVNHIMAKLASKNDVAIEFNFREVLNSSKKTRSHILHKMSTNVMLCKKFKTPMIITSGAFSHLQIRDPLILQSFGSLIGLEPNDSKGSLSKIPQKIIKKSKERRSKNWIMPGVKVVK